MSKVRHGAVIAAVAGTTLLTGTGVMGDGEFPERFDQWQSVVQPVGVDGLRIVDTFDQDFGSNDRHGPATNIAHDFGVPTDLFADSPDAPHDLFVEQGSGSTDVRIGDPDVIVSGQHRYTFGYTLPNAFLSEGVLSLDVLDPDDKPIDHFELVVTGMVLENPTCFVGVLGAATTCEFVESRDGYYRAVATPVPVGAGVTVEGDIVGFTEPETVPPPAIPERRSTNRAPLTAGVAGLGAVGAGTVYVWARRRGRNEVFAGGAADAAYGTLPPPGAPAAAAPPVELVPDAAMGDLATVEFVPPKGVAPWEAQVLLTERFGDDTVEAWLSGLAGSEAIELSEQGDNLVISSGRTRSTLAAADAALLDGLLNGQDPYVTGRYDPRFARGWEAVKRAQRQRITSSGWWKHLPPGEGISLKGGSPFGMILTAVFAFTWFGSAFTAFLGVFKSTSLALLVGLAFPALIAYFVYRAMLPARSAAGSALALRAESFRRFLHASEGQHVEWAWSKGLMREYSGWAVALGEADAWSAAMERANVPAPARAAAGPIILHRRAPSMRTSRTAPSPQGGTGGSPGSRSGGFRGGGSRSGRVGGGGGGRSRGSW